MKEENDNSKWGEIPADWGADALNWNVEIPEWEIDVPELKIEIPEIWIQTAETPIPENWETENLIPEDWGEVLPQWNTDTDSLEI